MRRKLYNRFWVIFTLGILIGVMLLGSAGIAAEDAEQVEGQAFDIDARLYASTDRTYDIQLTLGSREADWEGTVRVRMEDSYDSKGCVYDTEISLPQGSTKQFVVRIPKQSLEYTGGAVKVTLLDKMSNISAEKVFKRLLLEGSETISMGILSDSYQSLTYLDMGGEGVYYGGNELPIRLLRLDQDNLTGSLDSLIFLVIDNFNTGILTDETLDSIMEWVNGGGMLIVGTGEHAENTLSGLDHLDIACDKVYEPGESTYNVDYAAGLAQLSLAGLKDTTGRYYMSADSLIMVSSWGDGAVEIVPYALSDLGQMDLKTQNLESCLWDLLQNVNGYTRIQYNNAYQGYYDNYIFRRIFRTFGNGGSRLNFSVLRLIVVAYVIFVGPILYLILRYMKKRDWYWIAVPVTTLAGIFLVYFAGRGFEVVNTRVYSVTVEELSGQNQDESISGGDAVTYLHCYDAGHKEWGLQLAERYSYIGPIFESYYSDDDKYRSHIRKEGDRIFAGRNPGVGFEDCYFVAGTARKLGTGSISCDLNPSAEWGIMGTVTNGTNYDFKYFAVIMSDLLFVYGELPAGETCNLEQAKYTSARKGFGSAMDALQDYVSEYYSGKERKDVDTIAALGTGISTIYPMADSGTTLIIGVTDSWDKTTDDDCTETSYGCLYSVQ